MTDEPTIEDLCKPISAKVMPRHALYSQDHQQVTNDHAVGRQRKGVSNRAAVRAKRKRAKK